MMALIRNEWMKTFAKKSSWVYLAAIILAILIGGIFYQKMGPDDNQNWRAESQAELASLNTQLNESSEMDRRWLESRIEQLEYYLEEDINPNAKNNWDFMNEVVIGVSALVTLFVVIVCSGNVAAEFSDGTIKQLLIRPHQRWKILLSKYISVVMYSFLLVSVLIAAGYLIGLIMFGSGDFNTKVFEMGIDGQKVSEAGPQFFQKIIFYLPSLLMIMTISFMLSTLFKSQALAVGIGIFVLFFSSTLGGIIVMLADRFAWAKFLIFPHLDLTVYALQDEILGNITLPLSLAILGVYYAAFMIITFGFFQKRDISI